MMLLTSIQGMVELCHAASWEDLPLTSLLRATGRRYPVGLIVSTSRSYGDLELRQGEPSGPIGTIQEPISRV